MTRIPTHSEKVDATRIRRTFGGRTAAMLPVAGTVDRAPAGYARHMGIGTSIFLIAVGAILRYAVKDSLDAIDLQVVGLILMIVGVIGLLISLLYMTMWSRRTTAPPPERTVVRERDRY